MKLELTLIEEVETNHIIDTDDYSFSVKEEERVLEIAEFINEIKSNPRNFIENLILDGKKSKSITQIKKVEITNA